MLNPLGSSFVLVLCLLACGDSEKQAPECGKNQGHVCSCPGDTSNMTGKMVCRDDGTYGDCICPVSNAGAGGSGGVRGAGTGGNSGSGVPAVAGAYGKCMPSLGMTCETGMECVESKAGAPASYCSPSCAGNMACPAPADGSAKPACEMSDGRCYLPCQSNTVCPTGMVCSSDLAGNCVWR